MSHKKSMACLSNDEKVTKRISRVKTGITHCPAGVLMEQYNVLLNLKNKFRKPFANLSSVFITRD